MRTDAIIDRRAVICPNASLIGYSTRTARVGYFLVAPEGFARMLGRVHYAPALAPDEEPIRNHILAMVLSSSGRGAFERWINPAAVREVYDRPPTDLAAFFFAEKIPYDVHTMRRLMEHGTVQESYVLNHAVRVEEWRLRAQRDKGAQS